MPTTILIVDDEPDLVASIEFALSREGFAVVSANTGNRALHELAAEQPPDLVLLDLMLPDMTGNEVCRKVRTDPHTCHVPIIMLTAKDDEIDRVVGFELGADDYVCKPFIVRELVLRIRAILRRSQRDANRPVAGVFQWGTLRLDLDGHRIWVRNNEIHVTSLEFRLLKTLISRRGRVQTRSILLREVWGTTADIPSRTVDTHIQRLRVKLGTASRYIDTIRGVGYRFTDESEDRPQLDAE